MNHYDKNAVSMQSGGGRFEPQVRETEPGPTAMASVSAMCTEIRREIKGVSERVAMLRGVPLAPSGDEKDSTVRLYSLYELNDFLDICRSMLAENREWLNSLV